MPWHKIGSTQDAQLELAKVVQSMRWLSSVVRPYFRESCTAGSHIYKTIDR